MTVTLRFNGHMGAPKVQEVQVSDTDSLVTSIFTSQNLTPPITSESGYIFQGWGSTIDNVEPDLTVSQLMGMYHNIPDVVDVYAVYTYQSGMVQLTINPNGGTWRDGGGSSPKVFTVKANKSLNVWHNSDWDEGNNNTITSLVLPPSGSNKINTLDWTPNSNNPYMIMTYKVYNAPTQNMNVRINWSADNATGPTKVYDRTGNILRFTTDSWAMNDNTNTTNKWINNVIGGPMWLASEKYRFRLDWTLKNIPGGLRGSKYGQAGNSIRRIYFNNDEDSSKRNPRISDLQGFNIGNIYGTAPRQPTNLFYNSEFHYDTMGLFREVVNQPLEWYADPHNNVNISRIPNGSGGNYIHIENPSKMSYRASWVSSSSIEIPDGTLKMSGGSRIRFNKPIKNAMIQFVYFDSKMNRIYDHTGGWRIDVPANKWVLLELTGDNVPPDAKYFKMLILLRDSDWMDIDKPQIAYGDNLPDYEPGIGDFDWPMKIGGLNTPTNNFGNYPHFDFTGRKSFEIYRDGDNNTNGADVIEFVGSDSLDGKHPVPGIYLGGMLIWNKGTLKHLAFTRNRGTNTSTDPSANHIMRSFDGTYPGYGGAWYYGFDGTTIFIIAKDEQKGLSVKTPDSELELSGINNLKFAVNGHVSKLIESNNMIMDGTRWLPGHWDLRSDREITKGWVEFKLASHDYTLGTRIGEYANYYLQLIANNAPDKPGYDIVGFWSDTYSEFIPYTGRTNESSSISAKYVNFNRVFRDYTDLVPIYVPKITSSTTQVHLAEKLGDGLFYSGTVNERKDVTYSVNNTDNWSQAINYAPQITFNDHKPLYWRNSNMMPLTVQRVDATTVAEPKWMLEGTVDLYRKPREFFLIDRSTIFDGWLYMDKFNLMDKESVFVLDPTGLGAEYEDQNSNNIDGWAKAKQQLTNNDISFKAYYKGYAEYQRLGQWMTGKDLALATLNETGEPTYWMVSKKNIEKTEITEGDDWLVGTITFTKQSPGFDIETLGIGTDSVIDNNDMNPRRNTYVYIKSTQLGTAIKDSYVLATNLDTREQVIDKLNGTIPAGSFIEYSTIPYNELWAYGSKWGDYPNNLYSNIDPVNSQPIKLGPGRWDVRLSSGDNVTIGSLSPNKISAYQGRTIASLSGKLTNDSMVGVAIKEKEF